MNVVNRETDYYRFRNKVSSMSICIRKFKYPVAKILCLWNEFMYENVSNYVEV